MLSNGWWFLETRVGNLEYEDTARQRVPAKSSVQFGFLYCSKIRIFPLSENSPVTHTTSYFTHFESQPTADSTANLLPKSDPVPPVGCAGGAVCRPVR
ncbi:hypothetical protein VTK56DRAFT_9528 [Thermocarpiscus australiensis]